ncbi:MAG: FHA domain-containing protein [Cyanophyceae cyanobacterium]
MATLQPSPHLVLSTDAGQRYLPLSGGACWKIGRGADNDFTLPDPWISRHHAMLQCMEDGVFYLIDLGSRNGSFVNGRRVSIPVTLNGGDNLTFGQTEMKFYAPPRIKPEDEQYMTNSAVTAALHVRRLISVLVTDIRDFTGLTRQTDEKILSETIGTWFRQAGDILRKHGSWVDKYIGDAIMAVWIHGENDLSLQEVRHIFQAVDDLQRMTQELHLRYPLPFPLRIGTGVNTGYAMVGNTGSYDRPDYTALGDTVNEAFRLESCTKELKQDVAIGLTTYQYLRMLHPGNYGRMFEEYEVHLKGYDEPATTYAGTYLDLHRVLTGLGDGDLERNDTDGGNNGSAAVGKAGVDEVYGEEIELEGKVSATIPSSQEVAGGLEVPAIEMPIADLD